MSFVEIVELFLKCKFVFVITLVNDYGKVCYLVCGVVQVLIGTFEFVSYFL